MYLPLNAPLSLVCRFQERCIEPDGKSMVSCLFWWRRIDSVEYQWVNLPLTVPPYRRNHHGQRQLGRRIVLETRVVRSEAGDSAGEWYVLRLPSHDAASAQLERSIDRIELDLWRCLGSCSASSRWKSEWNPTAIWICGWILIEPKVTPLSAQVDGRGCCWALDPCSQLRHVWKSEWNRAVSRISNWSIDYSQRRRTGRFGLILGRGWCSCLRLRASVSPLLRRLLLAISHRGGSRCTLQR